MVAERGMARASLARIADRAGLSRTLTTHHFGSKDALIVRLVDRAQDRLQTSLDLEIEEAQQASGDLSALGRIRFSAAAYLSLFAHPTADNRALIAMWATMIPEQVSVVGVLDADRRAVDAWTGWIHAGQTDGSIRADIVPEAAGVMLLAVTPASRRCS